MTKGFEVGLVLLGLAFGLQSTLTADALASKQSNGNAKTPIQKAKASPTTQEWLTVPVFYATNRAFNGDASNISYAEAPNGTGLLFGVKTMAAPVPSNTPLDEQSQSKFLWQRITASPVAPADPSEKPSPPVVEPSNCTLKNQILTRDEIVPAFANYMKQSGRHEMVIFVHGCCANYDRSMQRAAVVAAHMQVPVLLYDWVSPKGFRKYLENETRAEQTMDDFCRFLSKVEQLVDPSDVTLLGHSMGARFVDQAMLRRYMLLSDTPSKPKFKELIMTNADVDGKSFLNHANQFAANAEKTRIYFNSQDEVLEGSALAHGGFNRLGNPGDLLADLCKTPATELIDMTQNESKHEIPFWIVANLHKNGTLGTVKDFQLKQAGPSHFVVVRTEVSNRDTSDTFLQCACK